MTQICHLVVWSVAISTIVLQVNCEIENKTSPTVGGVLDKVIPTPIKNFFGGGPKEGRTDETTTALTSEKQKQEEEQSRKEHGNFDFFGRDIIRGISKEANKIGRKIGFIPSNTSAGLDSDKSFFSGIADKFKEQVRAIYPGTLWCGDGNKARSYDDLGTFSKTDACCRDHDECPEGIPAGETKYDLMNTGLFTRSHCDCDTKFYNCLKKAKTAVSTKIGFTYFTVLGPQCFKSDYPIVHCLENKRGKCIDYVLDELKGERHQWFDSPTF